jgi:hypothetical protein
MKGERSSEAASSSVFDRTVAGVLDRARTDSATMPAAPLVK